MITKKVTLTNPTGLHARPATALVNMVKDFDSEVFITNGTRKANAGSIINLLTLGAKQGVELEVSCNGSDEEVALAKVVEFLEKVKD